jgi:hypothetical protein
VTLMVWLIVLIFINAGPPRVLERVPYVDMQSCRAEKAVKDSRQAYFVTSNGTSIRGKVFCSEGPGGARWLISFEPMVGAILRGPIAGYPHALVRNSAIACIITSTPLSDA